MIVRPASPKLTSLDKRRGLYPYYAGYSEAFVEWALDSMGATQGQSILDPWNGTGTTTTVAAAGGLIATGIDINPVLSLVAKARLATLDDRSLVKTWIKSGTSREHEPALHCSLRIYHQARSDPGFVPGSPAEALFVVGMFPAVRQAFRTLRTKNPSWYSDRRVRKSPSDLTNLKASRSSIYDAILETCLRQASQRPISSSQVTIINSDLHLVSLPTGSFSHIITSPPYLTRIDYVQATLPELYLLEALEISTPRTYLRRHMIGTPLTTEVFDNEISALPPDVQAILGRIKSHSSKASSTYYWRFFAKYFLDMHASLAQMADALRGGGRLCLVSQPSFYKDIFVDLPSLIAALSYSHGLELEEAVEFDSRNSMVSVNTRAKAASGNLPNETASFYNRVDRKT